MSQSLETLQRELLAMVKGRPSETALRSPYLLRVSQSEGLAITREIVSWWRALGLEQFCVLTTRLLKSQNRFEKEVAEFIRTGTIHPFIEELADAFLAYKSQDPDPLTACVAQFERALIHAKKGDLTEVVLRWHCNPYQVLGFLLVHEGALERWGEECCYLTRIAASIPGTFEVISCAPKNPGQDRSDGQTEGNDV